MEPIAVIGLACRFPGAADSAEALWRLLTEGRDGIGDVPPGRWPVDDWYDPDRDAPGKMNMRRAGFLAQDIAGFDAAFFGVAPREAIAMDPQQRLLLEVSWEALENAACPPDRLSGSRTGVFVGLYHNNYGLNLRGSPDPAAINGWSASGAHASVAAGRICYTLDLAGPGIAVDTACSSSLVAVHLALQSLQAGECDLALAGGVHLLIAPETLVASTKLGATAPDGRCKAFDAAADGFGHGEGCGIVVLRRLRDAEAAGDRVLAVIRGSCVNQDGRSNSLTAPSGPAQEDVVRTALARAGIAPRLVGYVEAHGTGTPLGDPIEVEALAAALGEGRTEPLLLGSVKTNLGHLEAAAGVAGLIKAILCVERGVVPAHLNFTALNPHIDAGDFPLRIPVRTQRWDGIEGRRIAGVSAFGFSGTNAHIVIEAPPARAVAAAAGDAGVQVLPLSARTPQALVQLAARWSEWLERGEATAAEAAYTAGAGRAHHRHRLAVTGGDARSLAQALRSAEASTVERAPRIAFLFTGQGSQYAGMTRRAYATQPVFRAALDRHLARLDALLGTPARALLFGEESIDATAHAQPLVVAVELALAAQWRAWGIEPVAVAGHSVGEYAAAAVAGVLDDDAALALVAARGRLMQSLPEGGGMLVVSASAARVQPLLDAEGAGLSIAALNGPANTVVSGESAALEQLAERLQAQGLRSARLAVSHAFHSALLEPMLPAFEQAAAAFPARPPRIPVVSNLTGKAGRSFDAAYWRAHARQPVRFFEGLQALVELGCDTFLEVGPQAVLSGMGAAAQPSRRFVPSLRRGVADDASLAQALATLYRAGAPIRWDAVHGATPPRKVAAPAYPFEHQRYWLALPARSDAGPAALAAALPPPAAVADATGTAVVFDFYDELTVVAGGKEATSASADDDEGNLSFGFLPAPVPGYSWVRALFERGSKSPARELFLASQRELKDTLFAGIDFSRMRRVLDYGCGHAADLCRLAVRHPHLQLQGYTISARQVEVGARRIARLGLAERVRLQRSDSSAVAFPGTYDLIFGIEVTGLIADKEGLFDNIAAHLAPGGLLVIADFVSTADAIVNPETNSFTPSRAQWMELLSTRRLRLVRAVDASADVADWLVDPDFESTIEELVRRFGLGALTRRHLLSNENIGKALRLSLMRYLLLTAQHAPHETVEALRAANDAALRDAPRYRDTAQARAGAPWKRWLHAIEWGQVPEPAPSADATEIARALGTQVAREKEALARLGSAGAVLDGISHAYTVEAFLALGCRDLDGAARAPVAEPMRRLRDHLVRTLAVRGAQQWEAAPGADRLADEALLAHPAAQAELTLLRRCGPRLADALAGRVDPLSLLFPDGDASLAEALYEHSPYSQAVQRLAAGVVASLPRGRPIAAIEIGAGTGATTAHVLLQLPEGSRYLVTDIGASLLARARRKFAGRSLTYAPLDISRPPAAQGIATGAWDLAIAANVLHATPELAQTLAHARDLLAPGALLLLVENTGPLFWGDLTFGLTPGMWNFRDTGLRDHALLRQAQWRSALEEAGFERVEILSPGEPDRGGVSQQCVILAQRRTQRRWLLTGGDPALAEALATELRGRGHELGTAPEGVTDVVYLAGEAAGEPRAALDPALALARGASARADPQRLAFVTRGAYAVDVEGAAPAPLALAHSALPGFVRTVAAEAPETRARLLDLDPEQPAVAQAAALAAELDHGNRGELAWRGGRRWQPRLRPQAAVPHADVRFDPASSYIVTGAFGGIGLALLPWMAARGARKLLLAVRRDASPQAGAVLEALRAQGVEASVQRCDVSRADEVAALVRAAQACGPLKGVLHVAGVVSDAALSRQDAAHVDAVFAAKVLGTRHLHEATAALALDHFVLFSSAAALLGPAGQANHAAACEFLSAFACWRRQQGLAATAIDWGAWADVGAATVAGIEARVERSGLVHMAPAQALHALGYAMAARPARIAVVDADWERYLARFPAGGVPAMLRDLVPATTDAVAPVATADALDGAGAKRAADGKGGTSLREALAAVPPLRRADLLREAIRAEAARVMALPDALAIDDERPLRDLGLDSLMAIELRNALVVRAGMRLPATLLFDHPSVAALAAVLSQGALADLFASAGRDAPADAHGLEALDVDALSALLDAELRDADRGGGA